VTNVRTPDGGYVEYASLADMLQRRDWLRSRLTSSTGEPTTGPRRVVLRPRKAL
jgi:hypothetical protein